MYLWSSNTVKLSITVFYLRIISRTAKPLLRWTLYLTAAFIASQAVAFTMAMLLVCRPVDAIWLRYNITWVVANEFRCGDPNYVIHLPTSILGLVTDVWLTVLPAFFLSQLQMPRRQKVALIAVFALGLM